MSRQLRFRVDVPVAIRETVRMETAEPDPNSEWWTTTDIAAYLNVQIGTISAYRGRGQMPEPDETHGRSHVWKPARIIAWHDSRPRPGVGGRPEFEGSESDVLLVTTATEDQATAEELAKGAVQGKLAAGAQITGPVTSAFWHEGEFGTSKEYRLQLVTRVDRYSGLEAWLRKNHPWRNPEILATQVTNGSADYLEWVRKATGEAKTSDPT